MNKLIVIFLIFAFAKAVSAQSYIDIAKFNYGKIYTAGYEGNTETTTVDLVNATLTVPIPINASITLITGAEYIEQSLRLNPLEQTSYLSSIAMRLGVSWRHNSKWSGTYLLIPKIAAESIDLEQQKLFVATLALLKYQQSSTMQYRFGTYVANEAFGTLVTPILGLYYNKKSSPWEIIASLPLSATINYNFHPALTLGVGLQSQVRSYRLDRGELVTENYVQGQNIEFGPFIQQSFAKNRLLLTFQTGYASIDYAEYNADQKVSWRFLAFDIGDNRDQLNLKSKGSYFFRIGASYRFHITENE